MYLALALLLLLKNMQCLNLATPCSTGIQKLPHEAECQQIAFRDADRVERLVCDIAVENAQTKTLRWKGQHHRRRCLC